MKYRFLLLLSALLMTVTASAQDEPKNYPHAFVGLQGGVMYPYNGSGVKREWSPAAALSFGYYFNPIFGLRLQGNGSMWDAKFDDGTKYESKAVGIDLDCLFNLSNVFSPNRNNFVNVVAVLGAPFNLAVPHTWVLNPAQAYTEGTDKWNTAWKIGGQIEFNLAKHWGFNLEGGTNYVRQRSSGIYDNNKWWPYAMAGITYKFGYKQQKQTAPEPAPVVEQVVEEPAPVEVVPAPVVEPTPAPVKRQPASMRQNVFFKLAKATIGDDQLSKIEQTARWAKEYPEASIALTGYADKGTGNARINKALSEKRAAAVKDALVKRGIDASRITTDWKGDTEQPFANNDDNRAVIIIGEEK